MGSGVGKRKGVRLGPAGLGVVCFLVLQAFFAFTWERLFQPATLETPWFLGSKTSIVVTQLAVALVALILALRARSWRQRFTEAGLMAAGVMAAAIAVFFLLGPAKLMVGPPELWPVALVSALLLLGPAALAGALLGGYLAGLQK